VNMFRVAVLSVVAVAASCSASHSPVEKPCSQRPSEKHAQWSSGWVVCNSFGAELECRGRDGTSSWRWDMSAAVDGISGGVAFVCVLSNGVIRCNQYDETSQFSHMGENDSYEMMSSGYRHLCAYHRGAGPRVDCWKWDARRKVFVPLVVSALLPDIALQISSMRHQTCVLLADGHVMCADMFEEHAKFVSIVIPEEIVRVASSMRAGCGVSVHGNAWCWGSGPLNERNIEEVSADNSLQRFANMIDGPSHVDRIAAGPSGFCAWKQGGYAWCWGTHGKIRALGAVDRVINDQSEEFTSSMITIESKVEDVRFDHYNVYVYLSE
jgi:hypothetical protein